MSEQICSNPKCYRPLTSRNRTLVGGYEVCSDDQCIEWASAEAAGR